MKKMTEVKLKDTVRLEKHLPHTSEKEHVSNIKPGMTNPSPSYQTSIGKWTKHIQAIHTQRKDQNCTIATLTVGCQLAAHPPARQGLS